MQTGLEKSLFFYPLVSLLKLAWRWTRTLRRTSKMNVLEITLLGLYVFVLQLILRDMRRRWHGQRVQIFDASELGTELKIEDLLANATENLVVVRNMHRAAFGCVLDLESGWKLAQHGSQTLVFRKDSGCQLFAFDHRDSIVTREFTLRKDGTFWVGLGPRGPHTYKARTEQVSDSVFTLRLIPHPCVVFNQMCCKHK